MYSIEPFPIQLPVNIVRAPYNNQWYTTNTALFYYISQYLGLVLMPGRYSYTIHMDIPF